ncbi:hypothetical protein [Parasediminibacterium sp. JCM 36343]|uniref:hypothetical protein n=1 Tax=Parasediminibacterium sp. JCM 36343 TaxID=3374279 RepID=UPI003978164F
MSLFLLMPACFSQKLTGIWRGYFLQKSFDGVRGQFIDDKYRYEIQINNLPSNSIEGVTYSYKTTRFYGKAASQGIYAKKTKTLLLKETKMLELRISDMSVACLMTCYLDYTKAGDKETLTGTYTSVNEKDGSECGSGTVYLEKVTTTEFEKEDFLTKKESPAITHKKTIPLAKKLNPVPRTPSTNSPSKPSAARSISPLKQQPNSKPPIKPGAEDFVVGHSIKKTQKKLIPKDTITPPIVPNVPMIEPKDTEAEAVSPVPEILQKRENVLSHTLVVDSQDATVEFYDNGQIDGDTISVYHNNRVVIDKKRLTYSPITMQVHIDEKKPVYEFIAVAENLGLVPPNTALVIVSSGSKHYEINITSDEQRNAKIILQYQKPPVRQ